MLRRDGSYGFVETVGTGGIFQELTSIQTIYIGDKFNPVEASIVGQSGLQNASVLVKK